MKPFNNFYDKKQQDAQLMENFSNNYKEGHDVDIDAIVESITLEDIETYLNGDVSEGLMGSILGGLAGAALGKTIGKAVAKALGIQKGVIYDLLTSRLVGAALGSALGK